MLLGGRLQPLDIGGRLIEVGTTDFGTIDYAAAFAEIERVLYADGANVGRE